MKLTNLIFKETLKINVDYEKMITFFKSRLSERYFKGFINRDETQLFFDSHLISSSFSPSLPIIQINFQNHVDKRGQVKIEIRIVTFVLIVFGLVNGLLFYLSIFHLGSLKAALASVLSLVLSYAFLLLFYRSALASFRKDIQSMITE